MAESVQNKNGTPDYVTELWDADENKGLVNEFLSNQFCRFCARGTDDEVLPIYREFAKQDYYYLIARIKFKALCINSIPDDDIETLKLAHNSLKSTVGCATEWWKVCEQKLGITQDELQKTPRSAAELGYESYLQSNASKSSWFSLQVITLPCSYGWVKLASLLDEDKKTRKDTIFYSTFIKKIIEDNKKSKPKPISAETCKKWESLVVKKESKRLFQEALRMEIELFNSVLSSSLNKSALATVYLDDVKRTYLFRCEKGKISYLTSYDPPQWEEITLGNGVQFIDALCNPELVGTSWRHHTTKCSEIRLYYIDKDFLIQELCYGSESVDDPMGWRYGALSDLKAKVYPTSHIDALSTMELNQQDQNSVQIRVIFINSKGKMTEAFIEKGEWKMNDNLSLLALPAVARRRLGC
ncbi:hypothetical protein F5Y01DRAFT_300856 [Xylaria sp. FL0043]|nr:hypothetical protein F5Y01DRAFT_300856 [Xylaria sp. FL0043]